MVFVRQQSHHVAAAHALVDQQRFRAAVVVEHFDEQFLHARLLHLLQGQPDFVRFGRVLCVYKDDGGKKNYFYAVKYDTKVIKRFRKCEQNENVDVLFFRPNDWWCR